MKSIVKFINEQVLNEGTMFLNFSDIDKVLKPYVKTYEKMKLDAEDWEEQSIPVKTINDAIVVVGDGFYGKEKVVEFVTTRFSLLGGIMQFLNVVQVFEILIPIGLALGMGIGFFGSIHTIRKHLNV